MAKRGRTSSAALAMPNASAIEAVARPDPPDAYSLTDDEVNEWWAVVNDHPADWFPRSSHGQLAQYCRHVVSARRVAELKALLEADPEMSLKDYDTVLKMQDRETKALAAIGTKLRITPQSLTNHRGNKKNPLKTRLWEE